MTTENLVLKTDSYKLGHYRQNAPGTTKVFSYIESRGGKYSDTVFFGLQYYLKKYFSQRVTKEQVEYAQMRAIKHGLSFNLDGWMHIVNKHNGKLPLRIRAVPEGSVIPVKNVLVTIENTDDACYWLTSYVETLLLKIWYPISICTTSKDIKDIIKGFLLETADNLDGLPFKLHDFGYRGVSSEESAAIGGAAHLVNFMGTDNIAGLEMLTDYYGSDMAGFSINATEHSTITSWGRENEFKAYDHFIEAYKDSPIFACVSDSYDIFSAIRYWGTQKGRLAANKTLLVVRPDSGDPEQMSVAVAEALKREFGVTVNNKGYDVLNGVRIIYGDGISSPQIIKNILTTFKYHGFSADNMAFGMGGGLLQKVDRDTQKFAMKCSAVETNGKLVHVYKEPLGQSDKKSKSGILDLIRTDEGRYLTIDLGAFGAFHVDSVMRTVYENGEVLIDDNLDTIRKRTEV